MDRKVHIPRYNITDDILNKAIGIVEKLQGLPLSNGRKIDSSEIGIGSLTEQAGMSEVEVVSSTYRQRGAGVFAGDHLLCRAPMPQYVEELMGELNDWLERSTAHPLIKAGIALYQYVMVQFYEVDNMRYGIERAQKLLEKWKPELQGLKLEPFMSRDGFVKALEQSDLYGEAGPFLDYFLVSMDLALEALAEEKAAQQRKPLETFDARVQRLLDSMGDEAYTTRALMEQLGLKHRPTFRDSYLLPAIRMGLVEMTIPDKPNSSNQKYRKVD